MLNNSEIQNYEIYPFDWLFTFIVATAIFASQETRFMIYLHTFCGNQQNVIREKLILNQIYSNLRICIVIMKIIINFILNNKSLF